MIEISNSLQTLILDHNKLQKTDLSKQLQKNTTLTKLSISYNPLTFNAFTSIIDILTYNKTLRYLYMKGIALKGSAPIKENPSGHLTKQEAVILKLAGCLRYSSLNTIGIDLDSTCDLQLVELEKALAKHNKNLVSIDSSIIK